jgi:hypothetical protein
MLSVLTWSANKFILFQMDRQYISVKLHFKFETEYYILSSLHNIWSSQIQVRILIKVLRRNNRRPTDKYIKPPPSRIVSYGWCAFTEYLLTARAYVIKPGGCICRGNAFTEYLVTARAYTTKPTGCSCRGSAFTEYLLTARAYAIKPTRCPMIRQK